MPRPHGCYAGRCNVAAPVLVTTSPDPGDPRRFCVRCRLTLSQNVPRLTPRLRFPARFAPARVSLLPVSMDHTQPHQPPRLLDQLRATCRLHHLSRRTEEAYCRWIRRFILFNGKRHPRELGAETVGRFLSSLAPIARSARSTQNQALVCTPLPLPRGARHASSRRLDRHRAGAAPHSPARGAHARRGARGARAACTASPG